MDDDKRASDLEIRVAESDASHLTLFDRSDLVFAALYGALFFWGLLLTLLSL